MKRLNDVKITTRITAGFIIIALLAGIVGMIGAVTLSNTSSQYQTLFDKYGNSQGDDQVKKMEETDSTTELVLWLAAAGSLVFAVALGLLLSNQIKKPMDALISGAGRLADGDLSIKLDIHSKDEIGSLAEVFRSVIESIHRLTNDTGELTKAATAGQLSYRLDASKHKGEYKKVVESLNATLDAMVGPLNEANIVMGKMAMNDLHVSMSVEHNGVYKDLAVSINTLASRLQGLEVVFANLAQGDVSQLESYKKVGKRSDKDLIMPALIKAMQAIKDLVAQSELLADAAASGDLTQRGDEERFDGGYREIMAGLNRLINAVSRPMSEASDVLKQMATGDYTISMNGEYSGSYAQMKADINNTIDAINEIVSQINTAADQVAAGTMQVSDGSQSLSQGAAEQASSIEELTVSLGQIAEKTKSTAVDANKANTLSTSAGESALEGNSHMKEMLKSMADINESSNQISKIIKVIDDIAFQTNLLALNAAVEAARAGQYGKGFAVVAEEVRSLAARSANAAKETTELIETSIKKVEAGTKIANDTAQSLDSIVKRVEQARELVGGIAVAATEQATAVTQVNVGIEQVAQVVQTTSATAEESAATSEELSSQATLLKEMVERFRLRDQVRGLSFKPEANNRPGKILPPVKPVISLGKGNYGKY
jgi:methyl-accepting chemotaxis protein